MTKRPRKSKASKPFTPPPPAAPDSEFSFGEYEQPNPDPFDHPDFEGDDMYLQLEYGAYEEAGHHKGLLNWTEWERAQERDGEYFFARRCGQIEKSISEDPFASVPDHRGTIGLVGRDAQEEALMRFERASARYVSAVILEDDTDKLKILADICAYWLRRSRRVEGVEAW
jgi:hypothetical protein